MFLQVVKLLLLWCKVSLVALLGVKIDMLWSAGGWCLLRTQSLNQTQWGEQFSFHGCDGLLWSEAPDEKHTSGFLGSSNIPKLTHKTNPSLNIITGQNLSDLEGVCVYLHSFLTCPRERRNIFYISALVDKRKNMKSEEKDAGWLGFCSQDQWLDLS